MKPVATLIVMLLLLAPVPARAVDDPVRTALFTTPTAETTGDDALRVSNTLIGYTQFNYGLTDDLQLGIQNLLIAFTGFDFKYRFLEGEHWQAAVVVGGTVNTFNAVQHTAYARPVVSWQSGRTRLSFGASAFYLGKEVNEEIAPTRECAPDEDPKTARSRCGYYEYREYYDNGLVANGWIGVEYRIGERVKLLGEFNGMWDPDQYLSVRKGWAHHTLGARFFGRNAAVDVGLWLPTNRSLVSETILGIPVFSFSYTFE